MQGAVYFLLDCEATHVGVHLTSRDDAAVRRIRRPQRSVAGSTLPCWMASASLDRLWIRARFRPGVGARCYSLALCLQNSCRSSEGLAL